MSEEKIQEEAVIADGDLDTAQAVEKEESATLETGENEIEQVSEDSPAKPKGVQKRIGELTHSWRDAQRERDYWRDLALKSIEQAPKAKAEEVAPAPTLESVDYDEAVYQQKMAEWVQSNIDQKVEQRLSAKEKAAQEAQQLESQQKQIQSFGKKAESFAEKAADYYDIAHNPYLDVSESMRDALIAADNGPEVLYHLGKNPQEASRIFHLPPHVQALEIGRLDARLSMPQPKKTTSAPPPIDPLKGSSSAAVDEDQMSAEEWIAMRNKQVYGA